MAQINYDKAAELTIICRKGDSFEMSFTGVQIDGVNITSSYAASLKVKASEAAAAVLTWETPNEITIGTGTIAISVSGANMEVTSGVYYYDLEITYPGGAIQTWLKGTFIINPKYS